MQVFRLSEHRRIHSDNLIISRFRLAAAVAVAGGYVEKTVVTRYDRAEPAKFFVKVHDEFLIHNTIFIQCFAAQARKENTPIPKGGAGGRPRVVWPRLDNGRYHPFPLLRSLHC